MVLRLRQHNIGYTADGFYRSNQQCQSTEGGWLVISVVNVLQMSTQRTEQLISIVEF